MRVCGELEGRGVEASREDDEEEPRRRGLYLHLLTRDGEEVEVEQRG
jgi:hypothetical protein